MIIDLTGTILIPGSQGKDCPGNGEHQGIACCDECDYLMCCLETHDPGECLHCGNRFCPHAVQNAEGTI